MLFAFHELNNTPATRFLLLIRTLGPRPSCMIYTITFAIGTLRLSKIFASIQHPLMIHAYSMQWGSFDT